MSAVLLEQAHLGGFIKSPSPSLEASKDEIDDGDSNNDDDEDKDASLPNSNEMTA